MEREHGKLRPTDVFNEYYMPVDGVEKEYKCLFCEKIYIQHITRMTKHIVICENAPNSVKDYVLDQIIAPSVSINVEKEEYEMSISEQVSLYSTSLFRNMHAHKRISIIILHI